MFKVPMGFHWLYVSKYGKRMVSLRRSYLACKVNLEETQKTHYLLGWGMNCQSSSEVKPKIKSVCE